jgi:hypothetical protein
MEIDPQDLDRAEVLGRTTADPGVPDRISSSRENLRTSVGLEANNIPIIIPSVPLEFVSTLDRQFVRDLKKVITSLRITPN